MTKFSMLERIDHCFLVKESGTFSFQGTFLFETVSVHILKPGIITIKINGNTYWSRSVAECIPFFKTENKIYMSGEVDIIDILTPVEFYMCGVLFRAIKEGRK